MLYRAVHLATPVNQDQYALHSDFLLVLGVYPIEMEFKTH
jgi:hypothetical protein